MTILDRTGEWVHDTLLVPLKLLAQWFLRGSFTAGFLAYRPDLGWPHGVQEDDDMHVAWTAAAASGPDETECPEVSPVVGHTRPRH